jgi:hypothetical protein
MQLDQQHPMPRLIAGIFGGQVGFSDRLVRGTACELGFHVPHMFATWV